MKKAIIVFVCAALLCTFVPPQFVQAGSLGGYEITAYDVKAVISADNVYDITETISVRFNEERHGIYRDIPVSRTCRVYDVSAAGDIFTAKDDGNTMSIRIGDTNKLITGDKTYKLSYKIAITDAQAGYDEVYYNLIATGWDADISNITFSVTLPKEFDISKVGFSAGEYGTSGYDTGKLVYTVQGNTVSGNMIKLGPYEGLTMRIELPEGYFVKPGEIPDWMGEIGLKILLHMLLRR